MTVLKRIAKILKWTVLAVCGLILLLYALIHLNVVQEKITSFAVQKISDKLGMQIAVGRIYPLFWDGVVLQDVSLLDAQNDTVLVAKGIMATVRSLKLDSSFVAVGKVALQKPDIRLVIDSSGIMNIQPLLDAFQSDDTTSSFHLDIDEITIRDADFSYKNYTENQQVEYGINYDNIAVSKLFLQAHSFCMNNGIYQLAIDKFSCNEQSGLQIQYLHTNALVSDTLIRCSDIAIYTPDTKLSANRFEMRYASFSDFSDFCEKVRLSADINHTTVSLSDISYFASALQDFPYSVTLEGLVEGTVSDMAAKNLHIGYGRSSQFVGSVALQGLPEMDKFHFDVTADKLVVNAYDIAHTRIPPFSSEQFVELPEILNNLTYYKYIGTVRGSFSDMAANGALVTNAGKISTNVRLKEQTGYQCTGSVNFDDFNLGAFSSDVLAMGKTTGTINLDAMFNSDSLISADIQGNVEKLELNGYAYSNVDVNGKFSKKRFFGRISIDDPNLQMKFGGLFDMSKEVPEFRFKSRVASAHLNKLNWISDSLSNLSFSLSVDFQGTDLDDMLGDVSIRNLHYSNAKGEIETKNIALSVQKDESKRKVNLHSAFVNATLDGNGRYEDLIQSVVAILSKHIPCIAPPTAPFVNPSNFNLNVTLQQIDTLLALFQSDFRIAEGSTITANYYGSDTTCKITAYSPKLSFNGMQLFANDVKLISSNTNVYVDVKTSLDSSVHTDNEANILGFIKNGSLDFDANWNISNPAQTSGNISCFGSMISRGMNRMPKFELEIRPTKFYMTDSLWNVAKSSIVIDSSSIAIAGFSVYKNEKNVSLDGVMSHNPEDYLVLSVQNYDLRELNSWINNPHVRLGGLLQGRMRLKNLYATPLVFADVNCPEMSFNNNVLGTFRLRSFWENKTKALLMKMTIHNNDEPIIAIDGKYRPSSDSVHFDVSLSDVELDAFAEILQGTVNDIAGVANADLDIDGTLSNLTYSGEVDITNGRMTVDYTHVPYTFEGKLHARKTYLFFKDFTIADAQKNTGTIHGFLNLKELTNPHYVFDIQTPKLLVMKTTATDNEYFYGTIYYKGTAKIDGDLNETNISCQGTTLDNTVCSIPVSYSELSGAYDFLFFSSDSTTLPSFEKQTSSSGLTLDLGLDVTPDALAQIIFDPKVGDVIKARGDGNLLVKMDKGGDLKIYGKYQIEEGDYLFTLKNLINKKLILQNGGTIVWNGDPLNAQVDLVANYETKASPQPLFDSTMNVSKRIPVTCQVNLKNNLLSPDISYNIVVPQSATQVAEVLATLSEDETTLQFFSLMLQGAFMAVNSESGVGSSVSFEVLSNQFNNLLSQIDPNMDVSVNYRMGTDNVTNNEFEFGISRQFWNDRIIVNVNGYTDFGETNSTESPTEQNQSNDFSGNVSVEMKLNKRGTIKVKGFSRSNDDELSERQENTNGIGFFFTKDFNTLRDLFKKERQ